MELIRQIKEAENTAKKLIEDSQKYAAETEVQAKKDRNDRFVEAQRQRKEAIAKAQSQGEKEGLAGAEQLKKQSEQTRLQLEQKAGAKMETAVKTVIEFIKQQS